MNEISQRSLMSHVSGTDIWHLSYQLDTDWQASYCFCPVSADGVAQVSTQDDQVDTRRRLDSDVPDPLNPARVRGSDGRDLSMISLVTTVPGGKAV